MHYKITFIENVGLSRMWFSYDNENLQLISQKLNLHI